MSDGNWATKAKPNTVTLQLLLLYIYLYVFSVSFSLFKVNNAWIKKSLRKKSLFSSIYAMNSATSEVKAASSSTTGTAAAAAKCNNHHQSVGGGGGEGGGGDVEKVAAPSAAEEEKDGTWRCPDPGCKKSNPKNSDSCTQCTLPRHSAHQFKRGKYGETVKTDRRFIVLTELWEGGGNPLNQNRPRCIAIHAIVQKIFSLLQAEASKIVKQL